jgi:hypothetical protein
MSYGRRSSLASQIPCEDPSCSTPYDRVARIDQIEKYGISSQRQKGQPAYRCIHCNLVWLGTGSVVDVVGRWDGVRMVYFDSFDRAHRPPKPPRRASPDPGLKVQEIRQVQGNPTAPQGTGWGAASSSQQLPDCLRPAL